MELYGSEACAIDGFGHSVTRLFQGRNSGHWAVARTRYRCEKSVSRALILQKIPVFLPLISKRRSYAGHIRTNKVPVFSGYLFFDDATASVFDVLNLSQVAQVIKVEDQEKLQGELVNLDLALERWDVAWQQMPERLCGMPVEVIGGPLRGLQGEFVRRGKKGVLIIRVSVLGRGVETEIHEAFVQPIT